MTHFHEASRQKFEVGEYRDSNATYDITIISYWKDPETQGVGSPVELVGYYFGGYDKDATNVYIDRWIANRNKEKDALMLAEKYLRAYLEVNRDFISLHEIDELDRGIDECQELLHDRSWSLEDHLEPAFKMNKAEYIRFIETLQRIGDISSDAAQTLLELQINYHD